MKQKTRKSMSKRIKVTASGKLLRGHAYSSHLKSGKSNSRLRRQKEPGKISKGFKKIFEKVIER